MEMRLGKICAIAALAIGAAGSAHATTLDYTATGDNQFNIYLSNNPNVLGTEIGSSAGNWQVPLSGASGALSGAAVYIQIVLTNFTPANGYPQYPFSSAANPSAFLGDFSLVGSGYQFLNGTTSLSTCASCGAAPGYWLGSTPTTLGTSPSVTVGPWINPTNAVTSYGSNGDTSTVWYTANGGSIAGISGGAQWIYYGDQSSAQFADLSTVIISNSDVNPTPLPSTWTMLLAGFIGLGFIAYRGKKKGSEEMAFAAA
jgi:hypothetical protein